MTLHNHPTSIETQAFQHRHGISKWHICVQKVQMVSIHLIGVPVLTVLHLEARAAAGSGDAPPPGLHLGSHLKQYHLHNQRIGLHLLAGDQVQVLIPDAQLRANLFIIAHMHAVS